jgi:2-methylisocitrate lyase-like PEP mutase family enzyme
MSRPADHAAAFRALHRSGTILVLPNAWDAVTARLVEEAGAAAVATTSAGVSWALGRRDGEGLTRDEMVDAVGRIARAVRVPVTADVERGYGAGTPEDVAETVRRVAGAGAVGVNVEDSPGDGGAPLLPAPAQAARLAAARRAAAAEGVDVFVNARLDVYLRQVGEPDARFDETVRRARAYVDAGADGIFVPAVTDAETIGRLVQAVGAPLNVMARPGMPSIPELQALGVARASLGPMLTLATMSFVRRAAEHVLREGTYAPLEGALTSPEANALFAV